LSPIDLPSVDAWVFGPGTVVVRRHAQRTAIRLTRIGRTVAETLDIIARTADADRADHPAEFGGAER
jgi:hypothetical protein